MEPVDMASVDPCTPESHAADKAAHALTLVDAGEQLDEEGRLELVYLRCTKCESTLAAAPSGKRPRIPRPASAAREVRA